MKRSKDPFEVAYEEEESPPESPADHDDFDAPTPIQSQDPHLPIDGPDDLLLEDEDVGATRLSSPYPSAPSAVPPISERKIKVKDDDDDDDEENMDGELATKFPSSSSDPDKTLKMKAILSQFTEDQMSRYESFRRSALQKANMRRLLVSITGSQKISLPMTIVVCGIAKMFVGELIETARIVMTERRDSGPIRPCHIRESYRRLKAEGKVFKRSVPRLFR